ncbi:MAG: FAD-dependent oxidoreductase [Desulfobacteraceae bacterium]
MTLDKGILIIGATPQGLQAALTLAQFGRKVTLIDRASEIDKAPRRWRDKGKRWYRYLLTQSSYHPLIELRTETEIEELEDGKNGVRVRLLQRPLWVLPDLCVDCEKCLLACPVDLSSGGKPLFQLTFPSTMAIDKRKEAPCRSACPIDMNPQGYVALITQGRFEEAYDLIRDKNPLPGICGRICHHPCETDCRRQEIDEPIAICALKRFAVEEAKKKRKNASLAGASLPKGPRVAIIGSGPAGLTAAHDLAKAGFLPTIIEAEDKPGGLMRQAIAPFRLPREILEAEIAEILGLGIELRLNTPIHSLKELKKLKAQGFKAILLATGASRDLPLNIPGEDLERVYGCVSFLKRLWNGSVPGALGRVVVIGGGNAAVEAARAALRSGAKAVSLVCLEKRGEMPAWDFEIEEALKEGVKIINGLGPKRFVNKDRRLSAIEFKRCTAVFDKTGLFNPQYDETTLTTIEADTAIVAIGQAPGISFIQKEADPSRGKKRNLRGADSDQIKMARNGETDFPGTYVSGDMVSGPSTVVEAMASGRRAAQVIIRFLQPGEEAIMADVSESSQGEYQPIPEGMPKQRRRPLPHRTVSERIKDNGEVVGPFSVKEAIKEASRCLQCGVCSECLRCQEACELGAIRHDRTSTLETLYFDRVIVADGAQMGRKPESSHLVSIPHFGKSTSWAKAMLAGRVAAMDALSGAPLVKLQPAPRVALGDGEMRVGIFICSCNGTLAENGQLEQMIRPLKKVSGVAHVEVLLSACHPEKGCRIEDAIHEKELNGALIASCTCCHLDFVCESCNDQRIRLKHRLFREKGYDPKDMAFINIKETCLLPFKDHSERGMNLATGLIRSGLWQLRENREISLSKKETIPQALILGATEAGLAAAKGLRQQISSVTMIDDRKVDKKTRLELQENGIHVICPVRPVQLEGQKGEFTLVLENKASEGNSSFQKMAAGIVILGRNEFKGIPYQRDPFVRDLHNKGITRAFATLETSIPGVYMASWSQVRKVPDEILGKAAASEGLEAILRKGESFDDLVAYVDPALCRGCGRCADICPEGAAHLEEISRGVAASWINPEVCTRCGNCMAECPTGAIFMPEADQEYFQRVIDVFL